MNTDFILSDGNNTNSKGYKIAVSGISLKRFSANPVMLFEHNPGQVIGRWENVRIENNKLLASAVFDTEDTTGQEVSRKVEKNFLRCTSIGVIPLKMEMINDEYIMTECELCEASIVSIPADAGAVRLYNDKMEVVTFEEVKLSLDTKSINRNIKEMTETTNALKLSAKTIESLSLDADYTQKDVELAVAEKDAQIETLNTRIQSIEKQAQKDFLSNAVKAGKISEAECLSFEKLADKGCFDEVKELVNTRQDKPSATLSDKIVKSNLTDGRENWDYMKWMKEDPKGLQKLKLENPSAFERLQVTFKNK